MNCMFRVLSVRINYNCHFLTFYFQFIENIIENKKLDIDTMLNVVFDFCEYLNVSTTLLLLLINFFF